MPLAEFPRYPLTFGPSPVHPLERLSRRLGGAQVWAKREDCNSGLAFGGNKTRKLEYWAGDRYGIPVQSTLDAIRLTGRLEGMIIDPVDEGKSMAGPIDLVTSGEIGKASTVLYPHLGGQPAINAYSALPHVAARSVQSGPARALRCAASAGSH